MCSNFEFLRNFYNSFLNFLNDKTSNAFKIKNQESLCNQVDRFKGDFMTQREHLDQDQLIQTIEDRYINKDVAKNCYGDSLFSSKRKMPNTADSDTDPKVFEQELKNQVSPVFLIKKQILNSKDDFLTYKIDQSQRDNNFMNFYKPFLLKEFDNTLRDDGNKASNTVNKKKDNNTQSNIAANRRNSNSSWLNATTMANENNNNVSSKEICKAHL